MFAKFVGFVAKRSVHIVARTCLNRINKDQSGHVVPKDYFCRNVDLEPPFAVFATARRPSSVISCDLRIDSFTYKRFYKNLRYCPSNGARLPTIGAPNFSLIRKKKKKCSLNTTLLFRSPLKSKGILESRQISNTVERLCIVDKWRGID